MPYLDEINAGPEMYGVNPGEVPLPLPQRKAPQIAPLPYPGTMGVANPPQTGTSAQPIGPDMGQTPQSAQMGPAGQRLQDFESKPAPEIKPLHGWKRVLDTIGQVVAPRIEDAVRNEPQRAYASQLGQLEKGAKAESDQQKNQADLGQTLAQTTETGVRTDLERNPRPKMTEISGAAGPQGEILFRDETGRTPGTFILGASGYETVGQTNSPAGPQTGLGQTTPVRNQSPEKIQVPPAQVQSFPTDIKASFPSLTDGQVKALVSQLGPNPTQADMAKVQANGQTYSKANLDADATKVQRDQVNNDRDKSRADREEVTRQKQVDKSNTVGWAFDPKTKEKILTNQAEAEANGLTLFQKNTPADVEKDESALRQMNDVQLNVSRYRQAVNALPPAGISNERVNNINAILSDKDLNIRIGEGGILPGLFTDIVQQSGVGKVWNLLSPAEQNVVTGYLRAKGSVIAYQKALTNVGRSGKEVMEIEMNNLPAPTVGATVANPRLDAFQENINAASQGFGRIPWMERPQDVRDRIEKPQAATATTAAPANEPQRPATVPSGYKWNANGPKGPGWYK